VNDRVVVSRDGRVQVATTWESPERATAFATAYDSFLQKRGLKAVVKHEGNNATASYTVR
jgi:hypothetical protein